MAAPFVMTGCREVLIKSSVHLAQQIEAIEIAVITNPGLAFDLAKTLIESACKTILNDRKLALDQAWDLPKLLKETSSQLQMVPSGLENDPDAESALRKALGGLNTAIQGICELRNNHGFASHGKDAFSKQLEATQALFAARCADTIVYFLFQVHRQYPATSGRRLAFIDEEGYNQWIDDANNAVQIFALQYRPSEVLYRVDENVYFSAYDDYLSESEGEPL